MAEFMSTYPGPPADVHEQEYLVDILDALAHGDGQFSVARGAIPVTTEGDLVEVPVVIMNVDEGGGFAPVLIAVSPALSAILLASDGSQPGDNAEGTGFSDYPLED